MTPIVGPIVGPLSDQHAELDGILADLDEADWSRPSALDRWSVADVVLHLAQTDEMARASATGRFSEFIDEFTSGVGPAESVDESAALMVAHERGQAGAAVHERWRSGAAALREILSAADPHQRVQWVAGTLSIRTLATTRLAECWIHTGDVAAAFAIPQAPTDRLEPIARLAWRTLPYAFERAGRPMSGPVAFELRGPSGARWDFTPDETALTTIRGDAFELCRVAARRVEPGETGLQGDGPDVEAVLELVRTYA